MKEKTERRPKGAHTTLQTAHMTEVLENQIDKFWCHGLTANPARNLDKFEYGL
jgi:hypothetical protein